MRSIFCGNFDYDARESDLEWLFRKYGRVERIDMKSGFAFIFMEDERDAEDAIRALDMKEFGRKGRRLRVEWTKQDRGIRKPMASKRNTRPSKTLFVINFDPINTRTRDLERHFDPYGKIENVRIRKNFAFIQFGLQEDATRALEATDSSKLMDHVISVEYSVQDDDKKNGYNPRDGPYEGGRDRGRSPSPYRRERASPDYGRRDPSPYKSERPSPDYGRRRSPSPARKVRENPDYTRDNVRIRSRSPYRRNKASPDNIPIRSRSPYRRDMVIPSGGRGGSPYRRDKVSPGRIRSHSPYEKERVRAGSDQDLSPSRSPYGRYIVRPDNQRDRSVSLEEGERVNGRDSSTSPYRRKRTSLDHDNGRSSSTYQKEKDSTIDDHPDGSPNIRSARVDSPISEGDNSPAHQRYHSQSPPPMLERSPSD